MKKFCSLLMVMVVLTNLLCFSVVDVSAGTVSLSVAELKVKFPGGKYWNHTPGTNPNPDSYSSQPCAHHGSCHYSGSCGCNSFKGAIQCAGFAYKLGYDAFGTMPTSWTKHTDISKLKAGDVVRYKNDRHSIFILGVDGDTVFYADCNWGYNCNIRWDATIEKSKLAQSLTYIYSAPGTLKIAKGHSSAVNKGSEFYAIINDYQKYNELINTNGTVSSGSGSASMNHIWKFIRQSDGSYVIYSLADGKCLQVDNSGKTAGTKISCVTYTGSAAQKWYIIQHGYEYRIQSELSDCVLDIDYNNTGSVKLNTCAYKSSQMFSISEPYFYFPYINYTLSGDGSVDLYSYWVDDDYNYNLVVAKATDDYKNAVYDKCFTGDRVTLNLAPGDYKAVTVITTGLGEKFYGEQINFHISEFGYEYSYYGGISINDYFGDSGYVKIPSEIDSNTVYSIDNSAFESNTDITSVRVSSTVSNIYENAFRGCTSLNGVVIKNGTTSIYDNAFSGCTSLKTIVIPDSVTHIGQNVFDGADNLTIYCSAGSFAEQYALENGINVDTSGITPASGDYNQDGKTSIVDVRKVLIQIANKDDFTHEQTMIADMNFDGKITISDARNIIVDIASGER